MSFRVSLIDLPRQEGASRAVHVDEPAPKEWDLDLSHFVSDIEGDLLLQSVSEGVVITGEVHADVDSECVRCLTPLELVASSTIAELAFYPDQLQKLIDDGDDEVADLPVVENDSIDLEPIIRDALVLSIPLQPLCDEDCQGLCAECGQPWAELPEDHAHAPQPSGFPALDALAAQLAAEEEQGND